MKLVHLIVGAFIILTLIFGVDVFFSLAAVSEITGDLAEITDSSIPEGRAAAHMASQITVIDVTIREFLIGLSDGFDMNRVEEARLEEGIRDFEEALQQLKLATESDLEVTETDSERRGELFEEKTIGLIESRWQEYQTGARKVFSIGREKGFSDALKHYEGEVEEVGKGILENSLFLEKDAENEILSEADDIRDEIASAGFWTIAIMTAGIIIAVCLGVLVSLSIAGPLHDLNTAVNEIRKGNLGIEIKSKSSIYEINALSELMQNILKTIKLAVLEEKEGQKGKKKNAGKIKK